MRFALHGPAVEVECAVPALVPQIRRLLAPFAVGGWPAGFASVHGTVRPYEHADVVRHLSPTARPLPRGGDLTEIYEEGERFWAVDDRWGMAEINFLKGQWRSWVLPRPQFEPMRCAETAALWPLAQLLRPRGLHLLPAASVVRNGWAALVLCPFGLEPELTALLRAGYKVIGQRWTAVREEEGRLALMHMPGCVERGPAPRPRPSVNPAPVAGFDVGAPRGTTTDGRGADTGAGWVDLNEEVLGGWQNHAFCDAVLVAAPARRAHASLKPLDGAGAASALRGAWPLVELHPNRRHSTLPTRLAQLCQCGELQLSRDPSELLPLLDSMRAARPRPLALAAQIPPQGAGRPSLGATPEAPAPRHPSRAADRRYVAV